ncbi:hypothetical protein M885DRAFT_507536 [Pelagophyceae sp. CCMP2097]|nr:hypothetical protein M885DRAFT_507536 [Pelagophyceae sp. CCMP2097]
MVRRGLLLLCLVAVAKGFAPHQGLRGPRRLPRLSESNDSNRAVSLEIRLDATVLWCHSLARELVRQLTSNPLKQHPGFTGKDLHDLASMIASASCLSVVWVAVGIATKQFEDAASTGQALRRTAATTAAAAPVWLAFEHLAAPATSLQAQWPSAAGLLFTMLVVRYCRY